MPQSPERKRALLMRLAILVLLAVITPVTSSAAQGAGQVRVKIVKAGLFLGGGSGSGVLTYRGRDYPFHVTGISLGITAGASVGQLKGWALGIHDITDFAGTYESVGGGAALIGGVGGVRLRNDKGVTMLLQGPKAGLEVASNIGAITISMR